VSAIHESVKENIIVGTFVDDFLLIIGLPV